jgi:hypothetical protein
VINREETSVNFEKFKKKESKGYCPIDKGIRKKVGRER